MCSSDLHGVNTLIPFHHVPVFHKIKFESGDGTIVDSVTVDESVCKDERSNDEEKDENVESDICQLLDQGTASQRRDVRVGDPTSARARGCRSLPRCIAPLLPDPGKL